MSTVLLERAAEWSINGPRCFLHHTSCQLGSPTWVGFVTQLRNLRPPLKLEGGKRWLVPSSHIIVGGRREPQAGPALLRRARGHAWSSDRREIR